MNRDIVPIESARSDDNGAYIRSGTSKRFFLVEWSKDGKNSIIGSQTCKIDNTNNSLYINVREGSRYNKVMANRDKVYELAKEYRHSKANSNFQHVIAYVRKYGVTSWSQYYVSSYFWKPGSNVEFSTPRHGNAQKATASEYYRTDPEVVETARTKLLESSPHSVYTEMSMVDDNSSFSNLVRNPKQLYNLKSSLMKNEPPKPPKEKEQERIIHLMKNPDGQKFVQSVVMLPESYAVFVFTNSTMKNVEKHCVRETSPLRFDTTFEIIDGLWVTDTSFTNTSLINERDGKHPEFPGPLMLHFKKDSETFKRFAAEIILGNPTLMDIKKIGHDMDPALKKGLKSIFNKSETLLCVQHIKDRDKLKLQELKASPQRIREILTDIYGCQVDSFFASGLVDSTDEAEFRARLMSLEEEWERKVPGFYTWFNKKRSATFIEQVIGEALDRLELCEKFTTNRLESFHRIQKLICNEEQCKGDSVAVLTQLQKWVEFFEKEMEKAFIGQGKYRLAPGFEGFKHPKYLTWSSEEKQQHYESFIKFIPLEANTYQRPTYAGLKANSQQKSRKRGNVEIEIFSDRFGEIVIPSSSCATTTSTAAASSPASSATSSATSSAKSSAKSSANSAKSSANSAKSSANSAKSSANSAKSSAKSSANSAKSSAKSTAKSSANSAANSAKSSRGSRTSKECPQLVVTNDEGVAEDLSFLDPYRERENKYLLVHRKDFSNCPKSVKRCEACMISFDSSDPVVIKTSGQRHLTDNKTGRPTVKTGNIYLHNMIKCLLDYDKKFEYNKVVVLKSTLAYLSPNARAVLESKHMQIEK